MFSIMAALFVLCTGGMTLLLMILGYQQWKLERDEAKPVEAPK